MVHIKNKNIGVHARICWVLFVVNFCCNELDKEKGI